MPVKPQTTDYLLQVMQEHGIIDAEEIQLAVDSIMTQYFIEVEDANEISAELLKPVIQKLARDAKIDKQNAYEMMSEHLYVINAKQTPKLSFNQVQHQFTLTAEHKMVSIGDVDDKCAMFRERFEIIHHRITAVEQYKPKDSKITLTRIKNLLGCEGQEFTLLGMLSCLNQGEIHLEDLDASVKLIIESDTEVEMGIFTETCIVLVSGVYFGPGGFRATVISQPPIECKLDSLQYLRRLDYFGGPNPLTHPNTLQQLVAQNQPSASLLIISDFWMDQQAVMDKFRAVLDGVEQQVAFALSHGKVGAITAIVGNQYEAPIGIVLIGDFVSPKSQSLSDLYSTHKTCWNQFWNLLSNYPLVCKHTHLIFVPGPNDPWCNSVSLLPQPALPLSITRPPFARSESVAKKLLQIKENLIHFASNPCRLKFGGSSSQMAPDNLNTASSASPNESIITISGQHNSFIQNAVGRDVVLFRGDWASKMCRNAILRPNLQKESNLNAHMARTILGQQHLSPLNPNVSPVVWSQDNALRLYPLPDLLVMADKVEHYAFEAESCKVVNPGSFQASGFSMIQYRISDSSIDRLTL
ncbi:hypothetical protein MP228_005631 [Amoeboaphelidium protococcarum]|nr:hypothetical protein MP228_005631 [Amoeboaphelidium protococcarum]